MEHYRAQGSEFKVVVVSFNLQAVCTCGLFVCVFLFVTQVSLCSPGLLDHVNQEP